jgi:hypothetical protein
MARKPGDKVGLLLRFDETLRRAIARSAKAHNRSMNAEIVQRLMISFQREEMETFLARHAADAAEKGAERAVRRALDDWFLKLAELPSLPHLRSAIARHLRSEIADAGIGPDPGAVEERGRNEIADMVHSAEPDPEKVVDLTLMKKLEAAVEERVAERVEERIKFLQSAQESLKREGQK